LKVVSRTTLPFVQAGQFKVVSGTIPLVQAIAAPN
jgi:hypothetical protein